MNYYEKLTPFDVKSLSESELLENKNAYPGIA